MLIRKGVPAAEERVNLWWEKQLHHLPNSNVSAVVCVRSAVHERPSWWRFDTSTDGAGGRHLDELVRLQQSVTFSSSCVWCSVKCS